MPLTDAEFDFLDAYVHELYAGSMTSPHTQAVRELGLNQSDLAWLLTAWHRQALAEGKSPLGSPHSEPVASALVCHRGHLHQGMGTTYGNGTAWRTFAVAFRLISCRGSERIGGNPCENGFGDEHEAALHRPPGFRRQLRSECMQDTSRLTTYWGTSLRVLPSDGKDLRTFKSHWRNASPPPRRG